ncbi:hypothetical protein Q4485_00120 [Granulosicoccaceae sp. 1_MG-2023]|nr:hypothetical protein [Granulosicoccaceae sp. 1_MG-2023]
MSHTIYVEEAALALPKTQEILARYPRARKITVERYGEIFNPRAQNFRLQKQNPALILALKHDGFVLPAPPEYNIGGDHNFYFSHMMNCVYDCRYCFLQGMYQSANYVVFVNYEDFFARIAEQQAALPDGERGWFFSGYDCDSLAFEPVTGFIDAALAHFAAHPQSMLELRTKSTQIRPLLRREAMDNVVVAFSLSPDAVVQRWEAKTPSLEKRLLAASRLAQQGWQIGLRFDPVVVTGDSIAAYRALFERVFAVLPEAAVHSVSLGPFRLPKPFYKKLVRIYPEESLFAGETQINGNMISAEAQQETQLLQACREAILSYIPQRKFFPCTEIPA